MKSFKHLATVALMLHLGVVGVYAQQKSVKMTFSGNSVPTTIVLQPGSLNGQDDFAGSGTLGSFTFRDIEASQPAAQPSTCSGPSKIYGVRVGGAGVFRFDDGSLLNVTLKQGSDCIDLAAQQSHCNVVFQITGGTGRFKNASGMITMTYTATPVLADSSQNPVFFTDTGDFTGVVSGVTGNGNGDAREDQ